MGLRTAQQSRRFNRREALSLSSQQVEPFLEKISPQKISKGYALFFPCPRNPRRSILRKLFTRDRRVLSICKSGRRAPGDYGFSHVLPDLIHPALRTISRRRGSVLNTPKTSMRVEELLSYLSIKRQPLFFKLSDYQKRESFSCGDMIFALGNDARD